MEVTVRHKKPCNDCPWRREHPAGWLGGYTAEWFTERVQAEHPINCHKTLEDGESDLIPEEILLTTYPLCAGSLIVQRNMCKLPRDPDLAAAVQSVERSAAVFNHPVEFLAHHAKS